ncbi:MAG: hypothetical protein KF897_01325 [Opitutaceae bacterium]|nr:hypothetical protein [Opitutaceae bacterium]
MPPFRQAVENWVASETAIRSAVVFGSSAATGSVAPVDNWSDLDLHVTTTAPAELERVDWARVLPGQGYRLQAVRPATGGVRKVTAVFAAGQIDLVIVPLGQLRLARLGLALGLQRYHGRLRVALDEIHTCLRGGYQFLKGEPEWGAFYARVAAEMPGVRLGDAAARALADVAVADWLWIQHKLARGELIAAQHVLHRSLAETNFRLLRELRLRRGQPLPSFGLGRHVERLLSPTELAWVRIDARCEAEALWSATERAAEGLRALMTELVGDTWRWPE